MLYIVLVYCCGATSFIIRFSFRLPFTRQKWLHVCINKMKNIRYTVISVKKLEKKREDDFIIICWIHMLTNLVNKIIKESEKFENNNSL